MQFKNKYEYRFKFFILFIVFAIVISTILYFILNYKNSLNLEETYKELAYRELELKNNIFKREVKELKEHIFSIKDNPIFQKYMNNKEDYKEDLENLFSFIVNGNSEFFQVRYIDKSGKEVVRVDKNRENNRAIIAKGLQNKSSRYYFKETIKLKDGEVYLSDFDLNIEYDKIEVPYKPTIRVATPIYKNNSLDGILIINKFQKELFTKVEFSNFFDVYLVDKNGYFTIHKDENKAWSKDLKTFYSIKDEFPNLSETILKESQFEKKHLFSRQISLKDFKSPYNFILIFKIKDELVEKSMNEIRIDSFIIGIIILILSTPIALIASTLPERLYMRLIKQGEELKKSMEMVDKYICYSKTDEKGIIIEVSSAFCENSGFSKGEIIGKTHAILRHPDNTLEFYKNLWTTILSGKIWQGEIKNRRKNGETIYDFSTIIPKLDENKIIVGFISIRQDITDKKRVEEQKMQLLFQSKHAVMGEMVSIIAHQWRQPLNVLSLKLFSLLSDFQKGKLTENLMENYYEESYEVINEMSKIIDTFRDFFKNKELEDVPIDDVIKDTLRFIDNILKLNSIDFIYNSVNLKVKAVKNELTQVILNIVKNSIDELKTKDIKDKYIKIDTFSDKDSITISILDNAGGVNEEILNKMFEPYFSTKSENGTGVGLYMCKLVIEENLHGKIYVKNEENGLKTIIKIPKKES